MNSIDWPREQAFAAIIISCASCGRHFRHIVLQLNTETLVDVLENTRNLDLGLGAPLGFSRGDHQALHKVWGTQLDNIGKFQAIELQ